MCISYVMFLLSFLKFFDIVKSKYELTTLIYKPFYNLFYLNIIELGWPFLFPVVKYKYWFARLFQQKPVRLGPLSVLNNKSIDLLKNIYKVSFNISVDCFKNIF